MDKFESLKPLHYPSRYSTSASHSYSGNFINIYCVSIASRLVKQATTIGFSDTKIQHFQTSVDMRGTIASGIFAALLSSSATTYAALTQVTGWGENPTNLQMAVSIPSKLAEKPAIVLAVSFNSFQMELRMLIRLKSFIIAVELARRTTRWRTTISMPTPRVSLSCILRPRRIATAG